MRQRLFRGNAAVHDPDSIGFAVSGLDAFEQIGQRGAVRGVAGQHFVTQGKAFRGDDQADHDLPTVAALVAAVAVLTLVRCFPRSVGLEVSAGQIVQQHVERGAEQFTPTLLEKQHQGVLVRQQLVQAAIQRIFLGQRKVGFQ